MKYNLNNISFIIEGESHSKNIILKIKGFKKGTLFDAEFVKEELKRRNPGFFFNTKRGEEDFFEIIKGIKRGKIVGKIVVVFKNNHIDKESYKKNEGFLRPSQSDYAQYLKNKSIKSGASFYSGRMTLPLTFVGAIAKRELERKGTLIYSKINYISSVETTKNNISFNYLKSLDKYLPVDNKDYVLNMLKEIKQRENTVGGILETLVYNPKAGLGGELNKGLESKISNILYMIPSVKAIEFGDGFLVAKSNGIDSQDRFVYKNKRITTETNHNGGILGGVSTGNDINVKVGFKPVPTFKKEMTSLNIKTLKEETISFKGCHDVFQVNRAIPCVEGLIALVLLDEMYEED